jgi:hypothetical protein
MSGWYASRSSQPIRTRLSMLHSNLCVQSIKDDSEHSLGRPLKSQTSTPHALAPSKSNSKHVYEAQDIRNTLTT